MTALDARTSDQTRLDGRFVVRAALAGFVLFAVAGGLLWWQFGATIFLDMLSFAQACF